MLGLQKLTLSNYKPSTINYRMLDKKNTFVRHMTLRPTSGLLESPYMNCCLATVSHSIHF
jgi:hypothetical protein